MSWLIFSLTVIEAMSESIDSTFFEVGGTSRAGMFATGVGATGGVSIMGALLLHAIVAAITNEIRVHLPYCIFPRIGLRSGLSEPRALQLSRATHRRGSIFFHHTNMQFIKSKNKHLRDR